MDSTICWNMPLADIVSEDVWALYSAPTSVLVHTVELVAREIEENMGLTFAYMPLRTYTRLAEYGLQICVVQR